MEENETMYVATVKPAFATEKALAVELPEEMRAASVDDIIQYALDKPDKSDNEERIAGRVRLEMSKSFGLTLNSDAVGRRETVEGRFLPDEIESPEGNIPYNKLEIVVAATQEGGLGYRL
jgi:hypothetical protein